MALSCCLTVMILWMLLIAISGGHGLLATYVTIFTDLKTLKMETPYSEGVPMGTIFILPFFGFVGSLFWLNFVMKITDYCLSMGENSLQMRLQLSLNPNVSSIFYSWFKFGLDVGVGFALKMLSVKGQKSLNHPLIQAILANHLFVISTMGVWMSRGFVHCYIAVSTTLWLAMGFIISNQEDGWIITYGMTIGVGWVVTGLMAYYRPRFANTATYEIEE